MEEITVGYIHSGKELVKNQEIFINLAKARGFKIKLLNLSEEITQEDLIRMSDCDIVYNDSGDDFAINIIRILEEMGLLIVESSRAYADENKWNFHKKCLSNDIPCPRTIFLSPDLETAKQQLIEFNQWPVVLKRVRGTWGEFVDKADNIDEAVEKIQKLWDKGTRKLSVIAQEFVYSSSYRVTYIGDEIVQTAIKENNNWKCTGVYARTFKKLDIDEKLNEIVKKIMNKCDIKICGIDLLKKEDDWLVIEVNLEPAIDFFEEEKELLMNKILDLMVKMVKSSRVVVQNNKKITFS